MTTNSIDIFNDTLNDIMFNSSYQKVITSEQYDFVLKTLTTNLNPELQALLKRLQHRIRRGWVRVT